MEKDKNEQKADAREERPDMEIVSLALQNCRAGDLRSVFSLYCNTRSQRDRLEKLYDTVAAGHPTFDPISVGHCVYRRLRACQNLAHQFNDVDELKPETITSIVAVNVAVPAIKAMHDVIKSVDNIAEAAAPFIKFIDQWERQPLNKGDAFYGIHTGTEFAAELKLSDLRKLRFAITGRPTIVK